MTWTATQGSHIFQQAMLNPIAGRCWTTAVPTSYGSLSADTVNVSLFGNTGTPSDSVTLANSLYGADQWVTGNEVIDTGGSNWPAGGRPLASKTFAIDATSSSICFGAANLAGAGNVTIANAYGCLVHDDTCTGSYLKQGLCFNYFGGPAGVTGGTFTIIWAVVTATSTVFNITV